MLRRNDKIYCVTGGDKFQDEEGHNILYGKLPSTLRNPDGYKESCWRYGLDKNIKKNHLLEEHLNSEQRRIYLELLEKLNIEYGEEGMRFLDKSQPYLTRTRYLQKLLEPADVYFIFLMRNPYVMAYKPIRYPAWYPEVNNKGKLIMGCQYLVNTYNCFMEDKEYLEHYKIVKYEDLILNVELILRDICKFIELQFQNEMIPQPPAYRKWHPIDRELVNQHRMEDKSDFFIRNGFDEIIESKCSEMIKRFKYPKMYSF